jgi:CBS domain-containing protein
MREHRVSALAVCADEKLIATISERDLVRAIAEGADPGPHVNAKDWSPA